MTNPISGEHSVPPILANLYSNAIYLMHNLQSLKYILYDSYMIDVPFGTIVIVITVRYDHSCQSTVLDPQASVIFDLDIVNFLDKKL